MPFQAGNKFGGRNPEGERLRKECRKVTDKVIRAWIEALGAEKPVVVSDGAESGSHIEYVVDHDVRIKAANALADRGYGRPAQAITGEDGGPVQVDGSAGLLEALKRLADKK